MNVKKDLVSALSIGFEIAIAVFLGAFIGYQIDLKLRSQPIGLIVGVALGGIAGMWNAIKLALREK